MSKAADEPPHPRSGRFWTRVAMLASAMVMALVIWASHFYLTRAFSVEQGSDAAVRATLYAGSIQSAMQRHSVVPLLLSRDPILILALKSGTYDGAEERLADFKEEIGAGSIFLLDKEGRIVAASDERPREQYDGDKAYFTAARSDTGTVFSMIENDDGTDSFHYARRIVQDDEFLGVVVVTVDLGLQEEGWRRARVKVVVTDSEGQVLLASEPNWRNQTLTNLLAGPDSSRVRKALRDARRSFGAPSYVYIAGTPHVLAEVPVGFRNWRLSYFATLDDVRARVNAVLSLIIMVLALILALAFYLLSRRTRAESRRIQRESEELRVLNRRLSSEISARKRVEKDLKEAEQSLEQASKLAALGQMSAAVSHELNQPLAAMKTYLAGARLLLTRRRPEEAFTSFQRIDDLIDRMGGITRQLKSYARKGDGEVDVEPVDVRDSVRAALAMMAPQLGKMSVKIQTTLPSEPAVVQADPLRIEQIIVNLLRNALDAVRGRDDKEIKIFLVQGETILLAIEDNGTGLKNPEKLFEPFYTTKKPGEGLGLGLAISAGFAAELGGRLVARNAPDGGAVFELVLPRDRGSQQAAE